MYETNVKGDTLAQRKPIEGIWVPQKTTWSVVVQVVLFVITVPGNAQVVVNISSNTAVTTGGEAKPAQKDTCWVSQRTVAQTSPRLTML